MKPLLFSVIHIIDPDEAAARELSAWLLNRLAYPRIFIATGLSPDENNFQANPADWLFIRITAWDDYQRLQQTHAGQPRRIVFLSGRNERRTDHLSFILDAHLQAPYSHAQLTRIWDQLSNPAFTHQSMDFFFLKIKARFIKINYCDLREIRIHQGLLLIETRDGKYLIRSTFSDFRDRLPFALSWIHRNCWINEKYRS